MKRTCLLFIGIICLTINAFAKRQNDTVLRGSVTDKAGSPAGFATVYLNNPEGALVVGTSADAEGCFELTAAQGDYILTASLVGYQDATQAVTLAGAVMDLPAIQLAEDTQMLGEAVVQAVMPKTKLTGEGLQTNVRGSVLECGIGQ